MFASWSGMRGRSVWGKDAFKTLLNVIIRREWQKRTRNWFCYLWSSEVIPWTLAIVPEKPKSSRKGIAWWMWRRWLYLQVVLEILGSSSNDEGDGNENGKKKNKRFRLAKQQPCTSITLFCAFPCRRCATTTWNCLISRVFGGREQRPSFAFSELWYSPLESTSRQIRQHLTSWTRWNKRDEVWTRANRLFNWRFRSRRRHRCWSSLL